MFIVFVSSLQQITKSEVSPPWSLEYGCKATPTYPPRRTLTIKPLGGPQASPLKQDLEVHLTLVGVESRDNQRSFILKSPSVKSKSPSKTASHKQLESPLNPPPQGTTHLIQGTNISLYSTPYNNYIDCVSVNIQ